MKYEFTKMHGCGNDYIYFDCFRQTVENPEKLAVSLSRRRFGIGADGVILICPSQVADAKMRMFNADGSEGKMCGNGVRCVGKYLYDSGLAARPVVTVETLSGIKTLTLQLQDGVAVGASVDMGPAELECSKIPVNLKRKTAVGIEQTFRGAQYAITCVSMGNPHCVTFWDDINRINIAHIGGLFEHCVLFPEGVNTEFVKVVGHNELSMRVWERGSGETLACGTGACASAVAAVLNGYCDKGADIQVHLIGGTLVVNYTDERVLLTGPAVTAFTGTVEVEA